MVAGVVVLLVWVGAVVVRGGGEKAVLPGWQDGMEAGLTAAAVNDRPMVVLFTAGWCRPCQVFKKRVLSTLEVRDALRGGYVPVQVDLTDQSSANPNVLLAQAYGVSGLPTVIAMTREGERIEAFVGERSPGAFVDWLEGLPR